MAGRTLAADLLLDMHLRMKSDCGTVRSRPDPRALRIAVVAGRSAGAHMLAEREVSATVEFVSARVGESLQAALEKDPALWEVGGV